MADRSDPFTNTATAPAPTPVSSSSSLSELTGKTIGRYRIERELGAGGMGVVYVAFDPDLERRIALKVLRANTRDAAKRLQREAKAMARLTHPNVVTVHEVATANDRDYVAMELVEGESLAEWLRAEPRAPEAIIAAYVAAGKGLAAAHAAGIVHRDFKPHNVLRGKTGRIAVTDFGLAREAPVDPASDPLAITLPVGGDVSTTPSTTPRSLDGLTATGAVLGTPAYMAPEQWNGAAVSPATDQFAFCVALWEALAGERPFRGKTVEELKALVEEGPAKLDPSRLPRRVRGPLLRGLDPDPAKRWPSIDALLVQLSPPRARTGLFVSIGAGVVAVGTAAVVLGRGTTTDAGCGAPALDPSIVWSPATAKAVAAGKQAETGRFIENDLQAWRAARTSVCKGPATERTAKLVCLDGVLSSMASVVKVLPSLAAKPYVDSADYLIDPAVCLRAAPRLVASTALTDEVVAAALSTPEREDPNALEVLAQRVASDPCAKAMFLLTGKSQRGTEARSASLAAALQASEACGDDRIRARSALFDAASSLMSAPGDSSPAKLQRAEAAIARVAQPDLVARLDNLRSAAAETAGDLDRAIEHMEAAATGMAARGRLAGELAVRLRIVDLRLRRGRPEDGAAVTRMLADWEPRALARLGDDAREVRVLARAIAFNDLSAGRLEQAAMRLSRGNVSMPQREPIRIRGSLVDERGAPVVGARVMTASDIFGTSWTAAMSMSDDGSWRETTTAGDGTFSFADAPKGGVVIAERGGQRSRAIEAADRLTLTFAPTSEIHGHVTSTEPLPTNLHVDLVSAAGELSYSMFAPIGADGSFHVSGVPREPVKLYVAHQGKSRSMATVSLDVREPVVKDVVLELPAGERTLYVVVRSSVEVPMGHALVMVFPGEQQSTTLAKLQHSGTNATALPLGNVPPDAVSGVARKGDLLAEIAAPGTGGSACAMWLPSDLGNPELQKKFQALSDKVEVRCVSIPRDKASVVIEVPPVPRLD